MESNGYSRTQTGHELDEGLKGQLVTCRPDELRPHPSYERHNLAVSASQLDALNALGDLAFEDPLLITADRKIINGYARWRLAQLTKRSILLCMECPLTEEEALQALLRTHRRVDGFVAVNRIALALDLKPFLQERAGSNRRAHSQNDDSSNLTRFDVRVQIAIEAGVSTGNVTKFEQLIQTAHPKVLQAAQAGEISLHKAWGWRALSSQEQLIELALDRCEKGTKRAISQLIRRHVDKGSPPSPRRSLRDVLKNSARADPRELDSIPVIVVNVPGKIAFLTHEAFQTLGTLEE